MAAIRCIAGMLLLVFSSVCQADEMNCRHLLVDTETMRDVMSGIHGYDTAASTNQSRFVADFLLALARRPEIAQRSGGFQVQPDRFFNAWLDVTGRDADEAPVSMRKVLEYGQRFVVETWPTIKVSPTIEARQVLGISASWPETPGGDDHYVYHDTLGQPSIRLRHERVITYQLIDFGEFVAFENIKGIRGKPTSGGLGALFGLLGMAEIHQSRFAVAEDQTQVNWSRVEKLFSFTALSTISPDGLAERGVPNDRVDLETLAERIQMDIDVQPLESTPRACDVQS